MIPRNTRFITNFLLFFFFCSLGPYGHPISLARRCLGVILPASVRMTSRCSQEGGVHHLRRQMFVLILCRQLFAPAYTETRYTPSGNPQTTMLKSEVSLLNKYLSSRCPTWSHPWEVRWRYMMEMGPHWRDCFSWPETKGASRRNQMWICCFLCAPCPKIQTLF